MRLRTLAILPLIALGSTAGLAQEARTCNAATFPAEPTFAEARVKGQGPAWLHEARDDCPWLGGESCRTGAAGSYGDPVIVSRTRAGYACVYLFAPDGDHSGWVKLDRLVFQTPRLRTEPEDWTGNWAAPGSAPIRLSLDFGNVAMDAAGLQGRLEKFGNRATYTRADCTVKLTLLPGAMVAHDNGRCSEGGGIISGVYTRD